VSSWSFAAVASPSRSDRIQALATRKEIAVNTRALILTIGTSLLLLAPAAQAARASNGLSCAHVAVPSRSGNAHKPFFSPSNPRGLEAVAVGVSSGSSSLARSACGAKPTTTVVAPNHFQLLRNAV
jgi:hypothetical protein